MGQSWTQNFSVMQGSGVIFSADSVSRPWNYVYQNDKVKVPPLILKKKNFNVEKSKMYGFFEFCSPVLRVKPWSKNFLTVKFVFPDPENTLKVKNRKKIFLKKKVEKT